jgi:radical SAM superfamily enzyme YgiQ (UPF0313 family)
MCIGDLETDMLKEMKRANCSHLYLGFETSPDGLNTSSKKTLDLKSMRDKVDLIKKYGLGIYGSFIIGTPTDTKESIENTVKFSLELALNGVSYHLFVPYPNINLRKRCEESGVVSEDWDHYYTHSNNPPFLPDGISADYLLKTQLRAYMRFYGRKSKIFPFLLRFVKSLA